MNSFDRTFLSPGDIITGKSVVTEISEQNPFRVEALPANPWPYGLSDYLQGFIGKEVQVRYLPANERHSIIDGTLMVAGSNFIGIRPKATGDLFIIESGSIRSVNIINFSRGAPHSDKRFHTGL